MNRNKIINIIFYISGFIYLFILIMFLFKGFGKRMDSRSINLIPFKTIFNYITLFASPKFGFSIENIFGNILLFLPMGIYLNVITNRNRVSLTIIILISILVEIIQYLFKFGILDIDDIILNSIGGFIGIKTYNFLLTKFKTRDKIKRITIAASIMIFILICLVLFYQNIYL
ncbi:VanZ family protein [Peptoniphilus lacydonensis]|uniref:VanZ family protein n=2 Tax=Peptoniphilus lacydonensis TaxID=1673725 RepID=UPI00290691DC|nr:VanZ family protein [Peptoniphilus lacydonensis]MDU5378282.1 VanZ family protein [Peptoniphilus lacydonensis]